MSYTWAREARRLYTLREAAQAMGVQESTIRHYCRTGILHCEHDEKYRVRLDEDEMTLLNHLLGLRAAQVCGTDIAEYLEEYRRTVSGTPERANVLKRISESVARGARNTAAYYIRLETELAQEQGTGINTSGIPSGS